MGRFLFEKSEKMRAYYQQWDAQLMPSHSLQNFVDAFSIAHQAFNEQEKIQAYDLLFF